MSPEYLNINNVNKNVRSELRKEAESIGISYEDLIHDGFGFNYNGKLNSILPMDNLTEGQKKDAKRKDSTWHIVNGLDDSTRSPLWWPDNGKPVDKYHRKKYRGNHRSHTRGIGIKAIFRNLRYNKTK